MPVKMIKVGQRDCILTRDHCIPFDTVAQVDFQLDHEPSDHGVEAWRNACQVHSVISGRDPAKLDWDEAKQLKKLLQVL